MSPFFTSMQPFLSIRKHHLFLIDLSATKASVGAGGLAQAKFSLGKEV